MPAIVERFAPLTYQMGFLEHGFEAVSTAYQRWRNAISSGWTQARVTDARLPAALTMLEPLTSPQSREILISTSSAKWTAYFCNGLRTADPASPVGYLCSAVPCRGVVIHCVRDRSWVKRPDALRTYGATAFTLFADHETEWLNVERRVSAINDGGKWVFATRGEPQAFEQPERYKARKIEDRLDWAMLSEYCKSLGIYPFDEEFYGGEALASFLPNQLAPRSPEMSLDQARRLTLLE